MANALFVNYRLTMLGGGNHGFTDWDADTILAVLVDHGTDTPVAATDEDLADILAGARVATSAALTTSIIATANADAADFTFPTVSGASAESLVFYKDTGTEATSPLIAFFDTATGLPVTPNGGNIDVTIDANGVYSV